MLLSSSAREAGWGGRREAQGTANERLGSSSTGMNRSIDQYRSIDRSEEREREKAKKRERVRESGNGFEANERDERGCHREREEVEMAGELCVYVPLRSSITVPSSLVVLLQQSLSSSKPKVKTFTEKPSSLSGRLEALGETSPSFGASLFRGPPPTTVEKRFPLIGAGRGLDIGFEHVRVQSYTGSRYWRIFSTANPPPHRPSQSLSSSKCVVKRNQSRQGIRSEPRHFHPGSTMNPSGVVEAPPVGNLPSTSLTIMIRYLHRTHSHLFFEPPDLTTRILVVKVESCVSCSTRQRLLLSFVVRKLQGIA